MSVYKEGYHAINLIQEQTKQIFIDACDQGAPTFKDDNLWKWVKQLIDWYGIKSSRILDRKPTAVLTQCVCLIDEHGTGKEEFFKVTYTECKNKRHDGFFEVEKITNPKLIKILNDAVMAHIGM